MNNNYLAHIAELEHKAIEQYADIPTNSMAYDMLIAAGVFVALADGVMVGDLAKVLDEPEDKIRIIYHNLQEAGYIGQDGQIILNIQDITNQKQIEMEYHLFILAGIGIVKKC